MKNHNYITYILLILLTILLSCQNKKPDFQWICDVNGVRIRININENDFEYIWDGETFDSIAHGDGVLKILQKNSIIEEKKINAFYGSINPHDIVSVGNNEKYIGDLSGDKFNGYGVYVKGNEIYVGSFKDSKPDGFLSLYKNGNYYYTGLWSEGKFNGEGTLYKEDGTIKTGDWENGNLVQTEVDVQLPEGHYKGYVKNNLPDGIGTMVYQDSSQYAGKWKNGLWDGEGTYITPHDTIFANWEAGIITGDAILSIDNYFYEGTIFDNAPNGIGNLLVEDSSFYSGGWEEGKRSGYGEIYFSNGDSYIGEWKNNEFNGEGNYIYEKAKASYEGEWLNGLQHGNGYYRSPEFAYRGEWDNGWMNGAGKLVFKNGDKYEGSIQENIFDGMGTYVFHNGNSYEGEFINGKFSGLGIFHFSSGGSYEGEFFDGKIYGDGTLILVENGELTSITGFWPQDGTFPAFASILYPTGDLYEGPLKNGFPTEEGFWVSGEERKKNIEKIENSHLHKFNEFYKRNRETINWCVTGVSIAVSFIPGAGEGINIAINVIDASMAIASAAIDANEVAALGEDNSEEIKTLNKEIALNVALIAVPKGLKQLKKLNKPLKNIIRSEAALQTLEGIGKNFTKKTSIKFVKNRIFGKSFKLNFESSKDGIKSLKPSFNRLSPLPVQANRLITPAKSQYVTLSRFQKASVKNLKLSDNGNSANLRDNMLAIMGKGGKKMLEKSKKYANKYRGSRNQVEAHHILTGFPNEARLNPDQVRTLKEAQDFFKQTFGSLDHPINGIFVGRGAGKEYVGLAKGASHGMHSVEYNMEVARKILAVKKLVKDKYKNDPQMAMRLLGEEMDVLKRRIRKGDLLIQKPNNSVIHTWYGWKKPSIPKNQ